MSPWIDIAAASVAAVFGKKSARTCSFLSAFGVEHACLRVKKILSCSGTGCTGELKSSLIPLSSRHALVSQSNMFGMIIFSAHKLTFTGISSLFPNATVNACSMSYEAGQNASNCINGKPNIAPSLVFLYGYIKELHEIHQPVAFALYLYSDFHRIASI